MPNAIIPKHELVVMHVAKLYQYMVMVTKHFCDILDLYASAIYKLVVNK